MGPDDGPVGLCRLQFGGEVLGPDGLLGIVLPSFVFLAKKLADELHGALGDTRERGPLELESEEEEASSLCKDWRLKPS